jgi:hypothetical protein
MLKTYEGMILFHIICADFGCHALHVVYLPDDS